MSFLKDKISNPLVSIIVPVYKVEQYLHTCVESVLKQTYNNWELILVDDGSPDNCPAICDEYVAKDKRIKVIHKVNGGVSSARNIALDNFQGDYVTFLDSDDFWHSDYLEILLNLSLKHDADIFQCHFIRGTENVFPKLKSSKKIKTFDNHSIFLKGEAKIVVWGKLYKQHLLEGLRIPEGVFFEDDFITWKWYYKANNIVIVDEALYYYTENNKSVMASHFNQPNLDFIAAYEERIGFFMNNGVKDLEDFSRGHLCKAMVSISNNKMLSSKQISIVDTAFLENWRKIRFSKNVMLSNRILFFMFRITPKTTLRLLNLIRLL